MGQFRSCLVLTLLAALSFSGPSALAEGAPKAREAAPSRAAGEEGEAARAAAFYRQGNAEYSLGHYAEALDKFERAFRIKQVPALLFNIAQCHRQLRHFDQAAITYRAFLRQLPESPQAPLASSLLAQVEEAMKQQERAQRAPPTEAITGEGQMEKQAAKQVDEPAEKLAQRPVPALDAARLAAPPPPEPRARPVAWIAGAVSVAALGGGAFFGLKAKSTSNQISSQQLDRAQVDALHSDLSSQAGKANLLFAVGAGLAALSGVAFLVRF